MPFEKNSQPEGDDMLSREEPPPAPRRAPFFRVFGFVPRRAGSLQAAVALMSALAVALVAASFYEKSTDTLSAQRLFYHALWFRVLLGIIGLSILIAFLRRFPFGKGHIGFLVTHIALLVILCGALINGIGAIEGTVILKDGETTDYMLLDRDEVVVRDSSGTVPVDVNDRYGSLLLAAGDVIAALPSGRRVVMSDYFANSKTVSEFVNDPDSPPNPSVLVTIADRETHNSESFWLTLNHPHDRHSAHRVYREIDILISTADTKEHLARLLADAGGAAPMSLTFFFPDDAGIYTVPLEGSIGQIVQIPGMAIEAELVEYMPNAKQTDEGWINDPEAPHNPALKYRLLDKHGRRHEETIPASYPLLLTDSDSQAPWHLAYAVFSGPQPRPRLLLVQGPGEKLHFSYMKKDGSAQSGEVDIEGQLSLEMEDLEITFSNYVSHGRLETRTKPAPVYGPDDNPCLVLELITQSGERDVSVAHGATEKIILSDGEVVEIAFRRKRYPLPFALGLVDSRALTFLGGSGVMAVESDVVVQQGPEGDMRHAVIRENEPLLISGYKVFQATPKGWRGSNVSMFIVAYDPGVNFVYVGCAMLVAGIAISFYFRFSQGGR